MTSIYVLLKWVLGRPNLNINKGSKVDTILINHSGSKGDKYDNVIFELPLNK